jgi:hypothetical protein
MNGFRRERLRQVAENSALVSFLKGRRFGFVLKGRGFKPRRKSCELNDGF